MAISQRVRASLRTDQGRVRRVNQDYVAWREPVDAEQEDAHGWVYILADGAGGMDAGEVASRYATERTLHHYLEDGDERDWGRRLERAMQSANSDLRDLGARESETKRMATTMVASVIHGRKAAIANVGDSRAYLKRDGRLHQITKDQSLVAHLLDEGAITQEEAANHPRRHVILYSLGSERQPRIDLYELDLSPGDRLLLCSDGLTRHVDDEEINVILRDELPAQATQTLIQLANERGGEDNISVGVVEYAPMDATTRVMPGGKTASGTEAVVGEKRRLWLYTGLLSLVQSVLMLMIYLWLQF